MKTAIFKLDSNDSGLPGLARVEVMKPAGVVMGRKQWKIRILEIVRPSLLEDVHCKVGQVRNRVWEGWLEFES